MRQSWEQQWDQPTKVSQVDLGFPARGLELAPTWEQAQQALKELPAEEVAEYRQLAERRFWGRPAIAEVVLREGVDGVMAFEHLDVVLGCYGFKHEHKIDAATYLASRWLTPLISYAEEES